MNYVKPTRETCWPAVDPSLSELEWRLRYAESVSLPDRLAAASVLEAYRELVNSTEVRRRVVIRALRKQQKEALLAQEVPGE